MCQIDLDSIFALNPFGTSNVHICSTECLLSKMSDNKSTGLQECSRIIRRTPHSPCRGSFFLRIFTEWVVDVDSTSNPLVIHLGGDGF